MWISLETHINRILEEREKQYLAMFAAKTEISRVAEEASAKALKVSEKSSERRFEALEKAQELKFCDIETDIDELKTWRASLEGGRGGAKSTVAYIFAIIGAFIGIGGLLVALFT